MHKSIRKALGYNSSLSEKEILKDWKKRTFDLCKPCWELKHCPYGPVVEDFPLIPPTREEAEKHNDYLEQCLKRNTLENGSKLDSRRKKWFIKQISLFNPNDYPGSIPKILDEASCRVFGHTCPVFFSAEPFTETKEIRKHSRSVPRDVMLKVVRRDGQICQICCQPVRDDEVEFDHVIPFSKGGRSTVENLRLMHKECNRKKSNSLKEILHSSPVEHLWELRKKK